MLQNIRDKTHGWVTRIIFGLVCVAFILWGAHSWITSAGSNNSAPASVNGKEISVNDINHSYQRLLQERHMQLGANFTVTEKIQNRLKQLALQKLVISTALVQSAEDNGLRYTPTQVGQIVSGISAFQQDGHFSQQKFAQALDNLGFSPAGFLENIRDAMLINQLRFGIIASSFALPNEVNEVMQLLNQQREIAYIVMPKKIAAGQIVITDAEIKKYYAAHQDQFTVPSTVTVQYLEVSLPDYAKTVAVSDDELVKFYETSSAAQKKPFAQVKDSLHESVAQQKALQVFSDAVDKLTNITYTHAQSLEPAAAALHLKIQTSPLLTQQAVAEGLFAQDALKSAAFSSEVLSGNNSSAINVDDKHTVVMHLWHQTPKVIKPLAEVQNEIIALLTAQKAENIAVETAEHMVAEVLSGKSLSEVAKEKNFTVQQADHLTRFNSGPNAAIFNEAFQLPRPAKQNSVGMFHLPSSDIAVIQVLNITSAQHAAGLQKIERNVAADKIENAYAQLAYELYVNDVLTHAKISVNNVDKAHEK